MTPKQWKMLEILEHWDGHGTIEVEIQWGGYDFGESDEGIAKGDRVARLVVKSMVRSLVAKGLARDDQDGYGITDAGRAILEKRRKRAAI